MTSARQVTGQIGEDAAAAWYVEHGYTIVARNWRVREGEIDIVAANRRDLVICEVKTRSSAAFGLPAEAVNFKKQARLRKLALMFVAVHPQPGKSLRFDVASVMPGRDGAEVEVIEAAF